jgi:hypothetical protein
MKDNEKNISPFVNLSFFVPSWQKAGNVSAAKTPRLKGITKAYKG